MATVYVDSNASGAANGTSWTDAYTTLQAGVTGSTPGTDVIWVAHNHAESQASDLKITGPANIPAQEIFRVNSGTDVYDSTTATYNIVTTTGLYAVEFDGCFAVHGLWINSNENIDFDMSTDEQSVFYDCTLRLGSQRYMWSTGSAVIEFDTCTIDLQDDASSTANAVFNGLGTGSGIITLKNPTFSSPSNRTCLIDSASGRIYNLFGADLSGFPAGFDICEVGTGPSTVTLSDCKLPATYDLHKTSSNNYPTDVTLYRCYSGDDQARIERKGINAQVLSEDTIVRTGGSAQSWALVSSAKCRESYPFYTPWIYTDEVATGSTNFDVHIAYSGTRLTTTDIWLEVEYYDTASSMAAALGTTRTRTYVDASSSNYTTASETWGGSETYEEYMRVTGTVALAGYFRCRVGFAKTSQTDEVYIDRYIEIS